MSVLVPVRISPKIYEEYINTPSLVNIAFDIYCIMAEKPSASKLWGGRFSGTTDLLMNQYNASLPIDKVMFDVDLTGTKAYTFALNKISLITDEELSKIHEGIEMIREERKIRSFVEKSSDEDIHTANERRLGELIGTQISGKVHTGRSRNDQFATDTRMYVRENLRVIALCLRDLIRAIIARAR